MQPVYNLDVARGSNFSACAWGCWCMTSALFDAVAEPFDAPLSQPPIALAK